MGDTMADSAHRDRMLAFLDQAAQRLGCRVTGQTSFGWMDRTLGAPGARADGSVCWIRVVSEQVQWVDGTFWTGNAEANVITDVSKPVVLDTVEEHEDDRWFRAEIMSMVDPLPVSSTSELHEIPELKAAWFSDLALSLEALTRTTTERVAYTQDRVTQRLREYFGERIDPVVDRWQTAHADLHWANLTAPDLVILDWEQWGQAPLGYDIATLYCHSLLVPDVADRIHSEHREVLDSPDGRRSTLLAVARMLSRTRQGDYTDLVGPLHRLADQVLGR